MLATEEGWKTTEDKLHLFHSFADIVSEPKNYFSAIYTFSH